MTARKLLEPLHGGHKRFQRRQSITLPGPGPLLGRYQQFLFDTKGKPRKEKSSEQQKPFHKTQHNIKTGIQDKSALG
ncbi:MAG: hypothetical protein WC383_02015 [Gammaproteobacteria bacterium]